MWMLITSWVSSNTLKLIGWGVAALSVTAILFGARQSGRTAERYDQLKKIVEIKDAQLRAALDAPRTRADLVILTYAAGRASCPLLKPAASTAGFNSFSILQLMLQLNHLVHTLFSFNRLYMASFSHTIKLV